MICSSRREEAHFFNRTLRSEPPHVGCYTVVLLLSLLTFGSAAEIRWTSSFSESYLSEADGNRIPFRVKAPPKVQGLVRYPLLVALKGSLRVNPGKRFPFFEVRPTRGNVLGYRAISTHDVMQVVAKMKRSYPIDPDRVYLVGSPAGASGAMHLASLHPDQFAALVGLLAAGNNYPAGNFLNLPVAFHHGAKDWTSAICDARVQYQKIKAFGCPVILKEYPNAGHSIPRPHEPIMEWLFAQKRNPSPERVTHWCESPRFGRSYWIEISEFADPHRPASVDAQRKRETAVMQITVTNALALRVHLSGLPRRVGEIWIGRQAIAIPAGRQSISLINQDGDWRIGEPIPTARRPYLAGAMANLLQGEPLLVVYGDGFKEAAQKVAGCGGPDYGSLCQKFPIIADTELTSEQGKEHNLVLIGTPNENSVTRRLLTHLPLTILDGELRAGGRSPLSLKGNVLSLLHFNPEHPQRLIYVVAPIAGSSEFSSMAHKFLVGSDSFDRGSQGDLVVQDLEQRILRQMQLGKNWQWSAVGDEVRMPKSFHNRTDFARAFLRVMHKKSKTDFALWWGAEDKGIWGADFNFLKRYDPEHFTLADMSIERRPVETMLGSVTGSELKQIWNCWGLKRELIVFPDLKSDDLRDKKSYRLHIPMDLYIKLGQ